MSQNRDNLRHPRPFITHNPDSEFPIREELFPSFAYAYSRVSERNIFDPDFVGKDYEFKFKPDRERSDGEPESDLSSNCSSTDLFGLPTTE